ncbi:hypothetical protein [Fictibacillus sp. KU28468]|uniref:hypothetical protein n=1 Tax=Fictibacillus sp. KU28468 TaxID=2991053 RepID=UPI00223CB73F|nr:hypothetical protein [Fictibacillus sp. KU28468]UZJ77572.1 hypothetical protein OKX00_15505 [Fictibacillus sp. KU28468]
MKTEKKQVTVNLIGKGDQTLIHPDDFHTVVQLLQSAVEEGLAKQIEHFQDILAFRTTATGVGETILSMNKKTNEILFFAPYPFKILAASLKINISYHK